VPQLETGVGLAALTASYRAITEDAGRLDEDELAHWSRCAGWSRADVLFHTLLDAQRALVTFATPATAQPDVDFVSYWKPFRPGMAGSAEHARFVRRASAAYSSNLTIVRQWTETAAAAVHSAGTLPADMRVATQGHALVVGDFMATLAVEASIHHLDLLPGDGLLPADADLTARADQPSDHELRGPSSAGLAVVRRTLDGILGTPVPTDWDDATYALKGTGRVGLTPAERSRLGSLAARFPLLG
jgi:Mycothiol maleylpyruvate isomerase N-terminal domain